MALTILKVQNAKPGLRPIRPGDKRNSPVTERRRGKTGAEDDAKRGAVQQTQFVETEKPYKLADEKGLYLEADPSGGKYWRSYPVLLLPPGPRRS